MAFHACNASTDECNDPRNHMIYIAGSDNAASWALLADYSPFQGSIPDIIRRGSTLYVYYPGNASRYNLSTGEWDHSQRVSILKEGGSMEMFVDPGPILDDQGGIVLFYLVGTTGKNPAWCPAGESSCTKTFRSATEVDDSDGTSFTVDASNRVEIVISDSENASDPDIFTAPGEAPWAG